jgi:hypothetical protein
MHTRLRCVARVTASAPTVSSSAPTDRDAASILDTNALHVLGFDPA